MLQPAMAEKEKNKLEEDFMKKVISLVLAVLLLVGISFSSNGSISAAYTTDSYTWNNVKIGGGGFVTGVVYNPVENGLLFARTDVGGA